MHCSADGGEFSAEDEAGAATIISRLRAPDFCREIRVPHPDLDEMGTAGSWCVEFSPDGHRLLAGDTLGVFFFDATNGAPAGHQPADYCWSLSFPDATSFCTGTRRGVFRWPLAGPGMAEGARIHEGDSNMNAASGDLLAIAARKELLLFQGGQPAGRFAAPLWLDRVALHPDGAWVASGYRDEPGISLWNLRAPAEPPRVLATTGLAASPCWTRDGRLLLVGDEEAVRALAADGFAEQWRIARRQREKGAALLAVALSADLAAAVIEGGVITLFRPSNGRVLTRLAHPQRRDIRHLALSPDGTRVAAMTLGHVVQLWDLNALRRELSAESLDWR